MIHLLLALLSFSSFSAVNKKASVVIATTKLERFSDQVQYPARVKSKINAWVVSESVGEVKKILKPIGSAVNKNDVVMIVQNTDPVYRYAPVKILAPAKGYVTSLEVELYNRVDRGQRLFSVTDPSSLVVETEIPAADLKYFKIGQKAQLKEQSGENYVLEISALSPAVDLHTGTASAELKINGSSADKLKQGEVGQVIFDINQRSNYLIPENALIFRDNKTYVRVLENNIAKRVQVKIATNYGDKVEIAEGLKEGQQLITRWSRFIADNEEVEIQENKKD